MRLLKDKQCFNLAVLSSLEELVSIELQERSENKGGQIMRHPSQIDDVNPPINLWPAKQALNNGL